MILFISKGQMNSITAALPLYTNSSIVELQLISVVGAVPRDVLLNTQELFSVLPRQRVCGVPRFPPQTKSRLSPVALEFHEGQ